MAVLTIWSMFIHMFIYLIIASISQAPPPEALSLAKKILFYNLNTLQVNILTPCYWSLRNRPLPPLSSSIIGDFVNDFNSFFSSGMIYVNVNHEYH